jgi:hypothetical protein
MHDLHGVKLSSKGEIEILAMVPEVFISDVECVPVKIDGRYYWLVVDTLDTLSSNYASISNPEDNGEGVLDAIEVSVRTGVDDFEDLLQVVSS